MIEGVMNNLPVIYSFIADQAESTRNLPQSKMSYYVGHTFITKDLEQSLVIYSE
jgi:hypothetical protein